MSTATTSCSLEQLAADLRESFIQVVYWVRKGQELAVYTDFVGNCEFLGLEGISKPRLVIRQYIGRDKPSLKIDLEFIQTIEIWREDRSECILPLARWHSSFGGDLERHLAPPT